MEEENDSLPFLCGFFGCGLAFKDIKSLQEHQVEYHQGVEDEAEEEGESSVIYMGDILEDKDGLDTVNEEVLALPSPSDEQKVEDWYNDSNTSEEYQIQIVKTNRYTKRLIHSQ